MNLPFVFQGEREGLVARLPLCSVQKVAFCLHLGSVSCKLSAGTNNYLRCTYGEHDMGSSLHVTGHVDERVVGLLKWNGFVAVEEIVPE